MSRTTRQATGALLLALAAACGSDQSAPTSSWTCKTARPALQGTWVGTLDNSEIVLHLEERCALGLGTFSRDSWSIRGSWLWKDRQDLVTGDVLTSQFGGTTNLSYELSLVRSGEGGVFLRVDSLPAGSTITAHVSGTWRLPPVPPAGPLTLRRSTP
jgi:hypothetical protein